MGRSDFWDVLVVGFPMIQLLIRLPLYHVVLEACPLSIDNGDHSFYGLCFKVWWCYHICSFWFVGFVLIDNRVTVFVSQTVGKKISSSHYNILNLVFKLSNMISLFFSLTIAWLFFLLSLTCLKIQSFNWLVTYMYYTVFDFLNMFTLS